MEFLIKKSVLYIAAKILLLTIISVTIIVCIIVLFVSLAALMSMSVVEVAWPRILNEFLVKFQDPLFFAQMFMPVAVGSLILFVMPYLRRHDRLWIDEHGIRFVGRYPRQSWQVAWKDIQLPIVHHAPYFHMGYDGLYIQLNRPDDTLLPKKERGLLFREIGGNRKPGNPVFKLNMVSMWQINHEAGNNTSRKAAYINPPLITDQRPAVVREIERYLRPGAIKAKRTNFHLFALRAQAMKTQQRRALFHELDSVAQGMFIGAFILFMLGLLVYGYWSGRIYSLSSLPTTILVCANILVAAISLRLLRLCKNAWLPSLSLAFICGSSFAWALYQGSQLAAGLYGQQEMRVFTLQAPLSDKPSQNEHVWQSGNGQQNGVEQPTLELVTWKDRARKPYHPGDQIELPVRRSVLGQYILNIEEGYIYFKRQDE